MGSIRNQQGGIVSFAVIGVVLALLAVGAVYAVKNTLPGMLPGGNVASVDEVTDPATNETNKANTDKQNDQADKDEKADDRAAKESEEAKKAKEAAEQKAAAEKKAAEENAAADAKKAEEKAKQQRETQRQAESERQIEQEATNDTAQAESESDTQRAAETLPQTGPADAVATGAILAVLVGSVAAYRRSHSI